MSGDELVLDVPYLLALNVGVTIGDDGHYYCDPSWSVDLKRHAEHLPQLTYLAPASHGAPNALKERLPDNLWRVVCFRGFGGRINSYLAIPRIIRLLLREIPRSRIVHTCISGYPIPLGWLAIPIARLFGKKIVVTVESSFWRIPAGKRVSLKTRIIASFWEWTNKWCVGQADYVAYQHEAYRSSLPAPRAGGGVLFQASWIQDHDILSSEEVTERWAQRIMSRSRGRFLFAARLVRDKGTDVLAQAIEALDLADADVSIDIIGVGPELSRLKQAAESSWGRDHIDFLDPMPYGPSFLKMLASYDAVLVPSLSDEQPRIIYDAYAQGVPVIASDRPGALVCVEDGVTGRIVPAGDTLELVAAIVGLADDLPALARQGMAARSRATVFTHQRMHEDRIRDLIEMLKR